MGAPRALSSHLRENVLPFALVVLVPWLAYYLAASAGLVGAAPGYIIAVVYVVYFAAQRHQRYSWTTFGERRSVDSRSVESSDESCAACGEFVGVGVERTYAEQSVAFGFPLRTSDWGENTYCATCVTEEFPSEYAESLDCPEHTAERDDLELA